MKNGTPCLLTPCASFVGYIKIYHRNAGGKAI